MTAPRWGGRSPKPRPNPQSGSSFSSPRGLTKNFLRAYRCKAVTAAELADSGGHRSDLLAGKVLQRSSDQLSLASALDFGQSPKTPSQFIIEMDGDLHHVPIWYLHQRHRIHVDHQHGRSPFPLQRIVPYPADQSFKHIPLAGLDQNLI